MNWYTRLKLAQNDPSAEIVNICSNQLPVAIVALKSVKTLSGFFASKEIQDSFLKVERLARQCGNVIRMAKDYASGKTQLEQSVAVLKQVVTMLRSKGVDLQRDQQAMAAWQKLNTLYTKVYKDVSLLARNSAVPNPPKGDTGQPIPFKQPATMAPPAMPPQQQQAAAVG